MLGTDLNCLLLDSAIILWQTAVDTTICSETILSLYPYHIFILSLKALSIDSIFNCWCNYPRSLPYNAPYNDCILLLFLSPALCPWSSLIWFQGHRLQQLGFLLLMLPHLVTIIMVATTPLRLKRSSLLWYVFANISAAELVSGMYIM